MFFISKKEVLNTFSFDKFISVKNILVQNNVDYFTKVVDQSGANPFESTRMRGGSFGIKQDWVKQYYIYVNKKDYAKALSLLR